MTKSYILLNTSIIGDTQNSLLNLLNDDELYLKKKDSNLKAQSLLNDEG